MMAMKVWTVLSCSIILLITDYTTSFRTQWEVFEMTTSTTSLMFQMTTVSLMSELVSKWDYLFLSKKKKVRLPLLLQLQYFFHPSFAIQQKYLIRHQGLAVSGSWWKEKTTDTSGKEHQLYLHKKYICSRWTIILHLIVQL